MPKSIHQLSDRQLIQRVESLVLHERQATLSILSHIAEVERRKLHLKLGHATLFDYCTRRLKYSASAAGRRIQCARCIRRFPEVRRLMRNGEMSLSTVNLIARVLNDSNKRDLLPRVKGRSQSDVEAIVSEYREPVALRDRVRSVCVRVPTDPTTTEKYAQQTLSQYVTHSRSGSESTTTGPAPDGRGAATATDTLRATEGHARTAGPIPAAPTRRIETKIHIQFLAARGFMNKYDTVRSLVSNRLGATSFEEIFDALMDDYIQRYSPIEKAKRRDKRDRRKQTSREHTGKDRDGSNTTSDKATPVDSIATTEHVDISERTHTTRRRTRYIRAHVKDTVFNRDRGTCTFVGDDGTRCSSTHRLHLDHIVPFACGGTNEISNLRLLCANHNQFVAGSVFGVDDIHHRWRER